jgi:hypothetical protein
VKIVLTVERVSPRTYVWHLDFNGTRLESLIRRFLQHN